MSKYRLTNKAATDLSDIWNYTLETWSERQANLYYEMLITSFQEIAENPASGRLYKEINDDLFGYIANRHVIFYRTIPDDDAVEIIRILHRSMDLKSRMNG